MKNKKVLLLMLALLAIPLSLCGCMGNYTSVDVKKYLAERGLGYCHVSASPAGEIDGEKYWNVTDTKYNVDFTVTEELRVGLFGSRVLVDNYDAKFVERYLDELPDHEGVELSIPDDMHEEWASFRFEYTNLDELKRKFEGIEACADKLDSIKKNIKIVIGPKYKSERMNFYEENLLGDISDYINNGYICRCEEVKVGDQLKSSIKRYFDLGYQYHFPEIESEMTEDDIKTYWNEHEDEYVAVYLSGDPEDENNKDYRVHKDILFSGYINFGNLYYLLIAEGFDVEGTVDDFSVYNKDGKLCRFSYEFVGKGEYNTYYLVDDEVVSCDANYFELYKTSVKDLFGLTIDCYKYLGK
ncbi:hypothetical protein D6853_06075 [Butyrivibrio sp. X503]|uniref:hypothetical protein n=1 Tax=Butyrivibrio sp. X503 TaxID=2364878 RepID=UPI000EA88309|nr:hypothetical protein [Butyrivibrio sp. X503]RKM56357.1 hypothetical protein D6853_06075 [Butyrivibrio sp. X503]